MHGEELGRSVADMRLFQGLISKKTQDYLVQREQRTRPCAKRLDKREQEYQTIFGWRVWRSGSSTWLMPAVYKDVLQIWGGGGGQGKTFPCRPLEVAPVWFPGQSLRNKNTSWPSQCGWRADSNSNWSQTVAGARPAKTKLGWWSVGSKDWCTDRVNGASAQGPVTTGTPGPLST